MTNQQSWHLRELLWPTVLLATVVGLDIALGPDVPLNGSYALAAVLAAALTSPRRTAVMGGLAVVLSVASATWNDSFLTTGWSVRLMLCTGLAVLAFVLARIRDTKEAALRHMTVVANTAQRALLRAIPREVGPLAVATRYVSATHEALVGGDLYEVAASPYGVRVLVGDVRGKGLDAVQLAGTVLGAFRKSAYEEPSLPALASDLDAVVTAVGGDEDFVTALVAEFHDDGTATFVNLAHHEPVLVTADGAPSFVATGEPVPPLGMGPTAESVTTSWPVGARMLFYTDGLVEARDRSGIFFDLPGNASALMQGDLEEALDRLLGALREHGGATVRDDVALLLLEHRPG